MATDKATLKTSIKDYLENTCGWNLSAGYGDDGDCLADAIAEAVVDHIKNYAETETTDGHTHNVV